MTEEQKKRILEMIQFSPADSIQNDLDEVRQVLYRLLRPVIFEINEYCNSDEDNEEKIESLFEKKDMIEQSIGALNGIIVTLAKMKQEDNK